MRRSGTICAGLLFILGCVSATHSRKIVFTPGGETEDKHVTRLAPRVPTSAIGQKLAALASAQKSVTPNVTPAVAPATNDLVLIFRYPDGGTNKHWFVQQSSNVTQWTLAVENQDYVLWFGGGMVEIRVPRNKPWMFYRITK